MAVRREKVILEVEDHATNPLLRTAAAAKTLDKALNDVDGTTRRNTTSTDRSTAAMAVNSREIDRYSGRLRLLAEVATILGPTAIPIAGVLVPAVTALAAQFGAAALAGGTALIAFQGVGDTLKAVNDAALEPTAENLEKARLAMQALAPEAQAFVQQLDDMRPAFTALRDAAAAGIFPGLTAALDEAEGSFDRVERVLYAVGDAAGALAEDFAEGLTGPRGREFLDFIATEMPSALTDLGHTVGNLAAGMGELWMAFTPLNRGAADWMLEASRGFDEWATGLAQTQGFEDFVAYIRANGPVVGDALASIGNALLQIVTAAAPLGGPVLQGLAAVADVIAAIAGSSAGPTIMATVTALALLNRGLKTFEAVQASSLFTGLGTSAEGATRKMTGMQRAAVGLTGALAGMAIIDAVQGGLEDYTIGVESMTASLLDLQGAAAAGLPDDLDGISNAIDRLANPGRAEALQDAMSSAIGGHWNEEEYDRAVAQIGSLDTALARLASTGRSDLATGALEGLNLTEAQMGDLLSLLPQYRDALAGVENQERLTGQAGAEAGRQAAGGYQRATSAAQMFRTELTRVNALLSKRSGFRDYEASLDDFTKSLRENGNTLDRNTAKGRANEAALDNIAATTLRVAERMKGTNKIEFLQQARKDFVDTTAKLLGGRKAAQELADKLGLVDRTRANPKVTVDTSGAATGVANIHRMLNGIPDETVNVWVTRRTVTRGGMGPQDEFAAGGYTDPAGAAAWQLPGALEPVEEAVEHELVAV